MPDESRGQNACGLGGAMSAVQKPIESYPPELVVAEQSRILIYTDENGDVVIHQYCRDEGDVVILVCPQNALSLVRGILKAAGFDAGAIKTEINVKDPTATERQRRHRDNVRDRNGEASVTVTTKVANDPALPRDERDAPTAS